MQAVETPWTVVEAITPKGEGIVLVSDPEGEFYIVEQLRFLGDEPTLIAYRLGPGDRLRDPATPRFARLSIPNR